MVDVLQERARKGRGAVSNRAGRFEPYERAPVDDGWAGGAQLGGPEGAPPEPLQTVILPDRSRSIIARNDSPDVGFDRSINPYRGCEHGCVYCFARPSHTYLGFSAGLDFETKIMVKHDAAELLEQELARPGYKPEAIALGANTDPYQPLERRLGITRKILEVLARVRHPVTIVTKSDLVLRDLDLLAPMAERRLARVMVSVTTQNRALARKMEPRAPTPQRRLDAIRALNRAGVPAGVLAAPMIPALNDAELEAILEAATEAGARTGGYVLLRLPLEIRDLFVEWLEAHFPDRKDRVMGQLRGMREGRDYDSTWRLRQRGTGLAADLLARRFELASKRLGLNLEDWQFDTGQFRKPEPDRRQLTLF